ncbi:MAG: homocysteine S-methyltransferase family protein [Myxococcota bacterium]
MGESPVIELAKERVVILDGAMGTQIQARELSPDDFDGYEGLNEILVKTRPDVIQDIHQSYVDAGADVIETNSFCANAVFLQKYGLADSAFELNEKAANLAKTVAHDCKLRPVFVSGSVGPTNRLPSLNQISRTEMFKAYCDQVSGLLAGGVDLLQIETCLDILQAQIAIEAANSAMKALSRPVPIICTVTINSQQTMLLGTTMAQAITAITTLPGVCAFGLNCCEGPHTMRPSLQQIAHLSSLPLAVLPNAGLPENINGVMSYNLGPYEFARVMHDFASEFGALFLGGCCGTTPAHIRELKNAVESMTPQKKC